MSVNGAAAMSDVGVAEPVGVPLLNCLPPMVMKVDAETRQTADRAAQEFAPTEMSGWTSDYVTAFIDYLLAMSLLDALYGTPEDKLPALHPEHHELVSAARNEFDTLTVEERCSAFMSALPIGQRQRAETMAAENATVGEGLLALAVAHDNFRAAESDMAVKADMWDAAYGSWEDRSESEAADQREKLEQCVLESINADGVGDERAV